MCGLVGIIGEQSPHINVQSLLSSIRHRGPDYSGIQSEDGWVLGHNRLAILDLDIRSNQPFESTDSRYMLAFNGEIYNYKALRAELQNAGYKFRTESDTEALLYAFDFWKKEALIKLHGMFAFAIVDKKERKVTLARDRFGEKPLFYHHSHNRLIFASELTCLKAAVKVKEIDHTAIIDYLHFGFIPAPKTIYKDIYKLEPGHYLEYDIQEKRIIRNESYYHVHFNETNNQSFASKKEEFESIGINVASQISLSDVPLGAFLSGGVDSSGAVYFLNRLNKKVHTFTAGFKSDQFDETGFAQMVVQHLQLKNTNKVVNYDDFDMLYDTMIDHYDEPHNDFSFIPTYIICKEASKTYTVMVSGDGADEIFCGYPRFHKLKQFSLATSLPGIPSAISYISKYLPNYSNLKRQLSFVNTNAEDFFFHTMSVNFQPSESPQIFGSKLIEVSQHYSSRTTIEKHLSQLPAHSHIIQKQRYLDIKLTLADDMLVKVDRASMANSMEVRPFYLHPLITDFAFSLPLNDLVTLRTDKAFLKRVLHDKLPQKNLYRRKMGFTFPLRELIQGPLKNLFSKCISTLPGELINKTYLNQILDFHRKNQRDFTGQLHSIMALARWLEKNS